MSAKEDLIAAALTAADKLDEFKYSDLQRAATTLREMCARAMVQPAAPDMAEVERLADVYADHVFSDGLLGRKVPSEHAATAHTALLDYVRGAMAERDALIHDNKRLMQIAAQEVSAAPQPIAAAEVAMPQDYAERPSDYTGSIWIESQMRTYGDAREAAGYAAGLVDAGKDAKRYRWLRDTGDASWRPFALREGYSAADADAAIDAALRGEVKPTESTNQQQGEAK